MNAPSKKTGMVGIVLDAHGVINAKLNRKDMYVVVLIRSYDETL